MTAMLEKTLDSPSSQLDSVTSTERERRVSDVRITPTYCGGR